MGRLFQAFSAERQERSQFGSQPATCAAMNLERKQRNVGAAHPGWLPEQILDQLGHAVLVTNQKDEIVYVSKMAEQITGYTPEEALHHRGCRELFEHFDADGNLLCKKDCPMSACGLTGRSHESAVYMRHKSGQLIPVVTRISPYRSPDGDITGTIQTFTQHARLAEAERRIAELEELAMIDPLTRQLNRRGFEQALEQAIEDFRRYKRLFSILFVDLDHFKLVNDNFGHGVGDELLVAVARTLKDSLRRSDSIGRWGGEEFVLLLQGSGFGVACVAERCRKLVAATSVAADIRVTASIGVTAVRAGDSAEGIIARADRLLYESKAKGRNRITSDSLPAAVKACRPAKAEAHGFLRKKELPAHLAAVPDRVFVPRQARSR